MRKEPFTVGSFVHVVKRGTRGLPIVRDEIDRSDFLLMLTHFNDHFCPLNWRRDLYDANARNSFERPPYWPEQVPLVVISAFALVENHFHLLLQEIVEGGISRFMQRLGTGMAKRFNERYTEQGSLFQGAYRARTVHDDYYFRYVSSYIQVKNAFDVHPKGYTWARDNFDEAYEWAKKYPYSSLGDYVGAFERPTVHKELLYSLFYHEEYREFVRDFLLECKIPDDLKPHFGGFFN